MNMDFMKNALKVVIFVMEREMIEIIIVKNADIISSL